jgi:chemotaxis family two-component system response regulator Rcp1
MIQSPGPMRSWIPGRERLMPPNSPTPVQILMVEDSRDDADLMMGALREGSLDVRISLVEDGEEAIRFLRRLDAYETSPRPDLILLDLHLPRKNGFEVLAELKEDSELRRIPVIIMTSTDDERAFLDAYNLHANCCVSKPVDQDEYALVVKKIENFWLNVARRVRWT